MRDRIIRITGLLWVALLCLSFSLDYRHQTDMALDLARVEARSSFEKDLVYRRWVTQQGGVYVPPSAEVPPNPWLRELPERDQIVVALYYWDRLTLAEIGQVLGVSESRVSQLHSRAALTLRRKLAAGS